MELENSRPGDSAPDGAGGDCPGQDSRDVSPGLRTRILSHCRWVATFDRAEAIRAFRWYDELLPWLELRRKE